MPNHWFSCLRDRQWVFKVRLIQSKMTASTILQWATSALVGNLALRAPERSHAVNNANNQCLFSWLVEKTAAGLWGWHSTPSLPHTHVTYCTRLPGKLAPRFPRSGLVYQVRLYAAAFIPDKLQADHFYIANFFVIYYLVSSSSLGSLLFSNNIIYFSFKNRSFILNFYILIQSSHLPDTTGQCPTTRRLIFSCPNSTFTSTNNKHWMQSLELQLSSCACVLLRK